MLDSAPSFWTVPHFDVSRECGMDEVVLNLLRHLWTSKALLQSMDGARHGRKTKPGVDQNCPLARGIRNACETLTPAVQLAQNWAHTLKKWWAPTIPAKGETA